MRSRDSILAAAVGTVATGLLAGQSSAAPVSIVSRPGDFEVSYQQNGSATDTFNTREGGTEGDELRIGYTSSGNGIKLNAVYYFQLPNVNPNDIVGADFMTSSLADDSSAASTTAPAHNADLWALGFDNNNPPLTHAGTAPSELANDYYSNGEEGNRPDGARPGVTRNNAKIDDDFLVTADWRANGTSAITKTTDDAGDAALLAYIKSLYSDPNFVPGESNLILRLNPDSLTDQLGAGTRRYNVSSAGVTDPLSTGGPTTDAGAVAPTLTLDVVPEPSSALLAGLAALGLLKRRR